MDAQTELKVYSVILENQSLIMQLLGHERLGQERQQLYERARSIHNFAAGLVQAAEGLSRIDNESFIGERNVDEPGAISEDSSEARNLYSQEDVGSDSEEMG